MEARVNLRDCFLGEGESSHCEAASFFSIHSLFTIAQQTYFTRKLFCAEICCDHKNLGTGLLYSPLKTVEEWGVMI